MGGPRATGRGGDRHGAAQVSTAFTGFGGGGYASHGAYMVEKTRKLKEQLAAAAETEVSTANQGASGCGKVAKPQIFRGLTFWMTGRTCVPDQELKKLIVEHGGIYEQYGSLTRVSHIIADNLAMGNQTWRELRQRTRRGHIVTSAWIVDCTTAMRRISEVKYLPECLSTGSTMLSFVGATSTKVPVSTGDLTTESSCADGPSTEAGKKRALSLDRCLEDSRETQRRPNLEDAGTKFKKLFNPSGVHAFRDSSLAPQSGKERENTGAESHPSTCSASSASSAAQLASSLAGERGNSGTCGAAPIATAAHMALEVNATCSGGLCGSAELPALLCDLSRAASNQLAFRPRSSLTSVGLRLTVEPLEEWSGFRDLAAASAVGHGVSYNADDRGGIVLAELQALSQIALAALTLEDTAANCHAGSWSSIRRVSVQLCLRELSTELPHQSCTTRACAPQLEGQQGILRRQRRWRRGVFKPEGMLQPHGEESSEACGGWIDGQPDFNTLQECQLEVEALENDKVVEDLLSPPHFLDECDASTAPEASLSVEDLCSQLPSALGTEACPTSGLNRDHAVQVVKEAQSRVGKADVIALVKDLRLHCSRAGSMPGSLQQFIRLTRHATGLRGFQDFAAALWALLGRHEFDVAITALRVLRSSIAASGESSRPEGGAHMIIAYFNTLLSELNKAFAATARGCCLDVTRLAETVNEDAVGYDPAHAN